MTELLPEEDKELAFSHIIYNLLISSLDKDIRTIQNSKLKLQQTYISYLEVIRDRVITEAGNIKKEMYKKGIKVYSLEEIDEDFVRYRYLVRGFESEFRCFKPGLKMHTQKLLSKYLNLQERN